MTLTVEDFGGKHEVETLSQLEAVLRERYGNELNGFWLSHNDRKHPVVAMLIKGNLATLLYVPHEEHPGFVPFGKVSGLDTDGFTTFNIDTLDQEIHVSNKQVIPTLSAISAMKEFFVSQEMPASIEWTEL